MIVFWRKWNLEFILISKVAIRSGCSWLTCILWSCFLLSDIEAFRRVEWRLRFYRKQTRRIGKCLEVEGSLPIITLCQISSKREGALIKNAPLYAPVWWRHDTNRYKLRTQANLMLILRSVNSTNREKLLNSSGFWVTLVNKSALYLKLTAGLHCLHSATYEVAIST